MDGSILSSLLPLVIIIVIFYFLLILPQKKAAKARADMLNSIKVGDRVETVSRVFGTVSQVSDDKVVVNIGKTQTMEIEIHKEGVARVVTDSANGESKAA